MVYSPLIAASKYFRFYINASNGKGHGTHSPFVFEFITKVMNDFTDYDDYIHIEKQRNKMLMDKTEIEVKDLGAGSAISKSPKRTVSSIAKNAVKPPKFAKLMYRMVKYYGCKNVIELGTSLGLTTAYLSSANKESNVFTLEGAPSIAAIAKENFNELGLNNIQLIEGNFDEKLPALLSTLSNVDFVYIDGNHRKEPTERYFELLLPKLNNDSILIFDDIHWSREMEDAWKNILTHESVKASIDLFQIGIVFFRKEFKQQEAFAIRY